MEVFFIHGMGQQYEEHGNMKYHVATMEKNTIELLSSHYPSQNMTVKYIPIEWHSKVHKHVDHQIKKSTLTTVPKVRLATNEWLMDCLYYFSKPYGQYIINSVCEQCNLAFKEQIDFKGQIHFIGFSLGGIIAFDIATRQWTDKDGVPPWKEKPDMQVPLLDFKINSIFTCGSPIAAGLICRGLDYKYYHPPSRTKLYNIFHPFDPLGYRLEPMIHAHYQWIDPVQIKKNNLIPDLGIKSSIESILHYFRKPSETIQYEHDIYPRIDYVLTESMIDAYASEWIIALKSHFRYWANK